MHGNVRQVIKSCAKIRTLCLSEVTQLCFELCFHLRTLNTGDHLALIKCTVQKSKEGYKNVTKIIVINFLIIVIIVNN